jgi:hypothetical protein
LTFLAATAILTAALITDVGIPAAKFIAATLLADGSCR